MISRYYTDEDTECHCGCGFNEPSETLMTYLDRLCDLAGEKLELTNVCRCEEHNAEVGGVTGSQHTKGTAADVAVPYSLTVDELAEMAERIGFDGIGKYYADDFIHVDARSDGLEPGVYRWTDDD